MPKLDWFKHKWEQVLLYYVGNNEEEARWWISRMEERARQRLRRR